MAIKMFNIIRRNEFKEIRKVRLNRSGKEIGKIAKFRGSIYYYTYREGEHFYIKGRGFCIDEGMVRKIIEEENNLKGFTGNKNFELMIIIFYDGKREKRYYLVDPYEFLGSDIRIHYTKDTGEDIETYGSQKCLPKSKMQLIGYDPEDYEMKEYAKRWGIKVGL